MSYLQALVLGIVQGITEFFPLSSSAHLRLFEFFFDMKSSVSFHLTCHCGTFLASFIFFRKKICDILIKERDKILLIIVALLPLLPAYFLLSRLIEGFFPISILGLFLILSSFFLFSILYFTPKDNMNYSFNRKIKDVLFIGVMQAMALIPGISRSGSTISMAYLRGWDMKEAISFSYILAMPAVLGGCLLRMFKGKEENLSLMIYLTGFLTSFIMGLIAINAVFILLQKKKIKLLAWYCFLVGISLICFIR